eukprot:2831865-Rhodomonas_salina.1
MRIRSWDSEGPGPGPGPCQCNIIDDHGIMIMMMPASTSDDHDLSDDARHSSVTQAQRMASRAESIGPGVTVTVMI